MAFTLSVWFALRQGHRQPFPCRNIWQQINTHLLYSPYSYPQRDRKGQLLLDTFRMKYILHLRQSQPLPHNPSHTTFLTCPEAFKPQNCLTWRSISAEPQAKTCDAAKPSWPRNLGLTLPIGNDLLRLSTSRASP